MKAPCRADHFAAAAMIVALAACGRHVDRLHDLTAEMPAAKAESETDRLDFGTAAARDHLLHGWSTDESGGGMTYAWAVGPQARLTVFLVDPRGLRARARCWPAPLPSCSPITVTVFVNGRRGDSFVVGSAAPAEYDFALPADLMRAGENVLDLHSSAFSGSSGCGRLADPRPLAVAWDALRLEPLPQAEPPRVEMSRPPYLLLPPGSAVVYDLKLPAGSALAWGALEAAGAGDRQLVLRKLQGGNLEERRVRSDRPGRWPLTSLNAGGLVEVTLAVPSGAATLRVAEPRIEGVQIMARSKPAPLSARANVLLWVVDTVRSDHLSAFGYDRPTSPELEEFARHAVVFDRAHANSSWTRPAVATILTGLPPGEHGVVDRQHALSDAAPYLPAILADRGVHAGAFITNGNLKALFGFSRGFDPFVYLPPDFAQPTVIAPAERAVDAALSWLRELPAGQPFFAYLHVSDPHAPYTPRADDRARFDRLAGTGQERVSVQELSDLNLGLRQPGADTRTNLIDLYDAEIAHADREFGRLLAGLREAGRLEDTAVIFTADHGEEFLDHGAWDHGRTLYEEQLHIPLAISAPGVRGGRRSAAAVQQLDLAPTILDLLGFPPRAALSGRSLATLITDPESPWQERPLVGHLSLDGRRLDSIADGPDKLILYHSLDGSHAAEEIFNLAADPKETNNLGQRDPVLSGFLRMLLRLQQAGLPASRPDNVELDEETARTLRALGYLR